MARDVLAQKVQTLSWNDISFVRSTRPRRVPSINHLYKTTSLFRDLIFSVDKIDPSSMYGSAGCRSCFLVEIMYDLFSS